MKVFKQAFAALFVAGSVFGSPARAEKAPPEPTERQKIAMAMFNERCKKAGEFIHRTVDNVEGIFLLKVRPAGINYDKQYELDDPYGRDLSGEGGYIESFLRGSYEAGSGKPVPIRESSRGYLYVEAVDPKEGVRYRYTGEVKEVTRTMSVMSGGDGKTKFNTNEYVIDRAKSSSAPPRYGVTYDDISTHEERDYWIAGSSLKVIDLQTKELLGERIGYMVDIFQGSRVGGRAPWLLAANHACPSFASGSSGQRRQSYQFVEKVLKPKR